MYCNPNIADNGHTGEASPGEVLDCGMVLVGVRLNQTCLMEGSAYAF